MSKVASATGILGAFLVLMVAASVALPKPDEEHYFDREDAKELAGWLAAMGRPSGYINLPSCRYFYGDNYLSGPMPKRNSELINSLLSLPKTMNDAGK